MKLSRLFLLCCISQIAVFMYSCSSDSDNIGDSNEQIITADENFIEVQVNRQNFQPDEVAVNAEGDFVNIVGTETSSNRSVFLTFKLLGEGTLNLGDSSENPEGNIAGFLLNTENKGYLTNGIEGNWGEIKITKLDLENRKISGTFHFTAYDQEYRPIVLEDGSFIDVSY
ncbi:DUF6252 family protein [Ascidiimonas sp. W6]|uniref:DUF6252 family protein n=1 Tax=Ascidiimonas meishanensis TaxID=3128903 RepID=UPI0030EDFDC5